MAREFVGVDRGQLLLMPPSLTDWLPAGHLVWTVLVAVEDMDLSTFYGAYRLDGHGRAAYEPSTMGWIQLVVATPNVEELRWPRRVVLQIVPLQQGRVSTATALSRAAGPLRKFMVHYAREKDVALFVELSKEPAPRTPDDLSLRVLVPSYILSELKAGFQIGAVLFLPFLVIDMVVASITTSVGMMQLPPVVISTPLKILLFVMVDGWNLLIGSVVRSFN